MWLMLSGMAWAIPPACQGFANTRTITINHTKVGSTDTANYPVLLCFNGACPNSTTLLDLKTAANSGLIQNTVTSNGITIPADMAFCSDSTPFNILPHFVKTYTASSGSMSVRVRVKNISHTVDTVIYIGYNNPHVTTDLSDKFTTFSGKYGGWIGMEENAANTTVSDDLGVLGATDGSNTSTVTTTGMVANGFTTGSSKTIITTASSTIAPIGANARSLFGWVKTSGTVSGRVAYFGYGASSSGLAAVLESGINSDGKIYFVGFSHDITGTCVVGDGSWHLIGYTYDGTTVRLYVDGAACGSGAQALNTAASSLYLAQQPWADGGNSWIMTGTMDEFRLITRTVSADEAILMFNDETNPSTFITLGSSVAPTACGTGTYSQPITIDHLQAGSTNTSNFPYVFAGMDGCQATQSNGGSVYNVNGYDRGFYSDSLCTTKLDWQTEYYNGNDGEFEDWIRIPTLSASVDTVIYYCHGSHSITTYQGLNWMGTYGYVGVFHGGTPLAVDCNDSGSAARNLTLGASMTVSGRGLLGGAIVIPAGGIDADTCGFTPTGSDKISNYGYVVGSNSPWHYTAWYQDAPTTRTACINGCSYGGWGKANGTGAAQWQWENRPAAPDSISGFTIKAIENGDPGRFSAVSSSSSPNYPINGDFDWHRVDVDCTGSTINGCTIRFDGSTITNLVTTSGATTINIDNADGLSGGPAELRIGRSPAHGNYRYVGNLDEIRWTATSIGGDQITAEINNQRSPSTFSTLGVTTPVSSGSVRHRVTN
jgi:hypothetical protein